MSVAFTPPSGLEEGVSAGIERATEQFGLSPAPQGRVLAQMQSELQDQPMGAASAALFAETLTVASIGRQELGQPPLTAQLIREARRFFEVIFDGLVER
jgi:hypothetical protein